MDRKEIEFEFERATKNTYRFQEKSTGSPVIGTLYVQRNPVRAEIGIRGKGTEEGEGNGGVGVDNNRITFVVR